MLVEAEDPATSLFYFSVEWAVDACDFLEKLPLSKGGKPGERLVLAPWQCWVACSIFGFRRADPAFPKTWDERLVRDVYLEVPRGSGKSELAGGIVLYCFNCEDVTGSQIYIGAPKVEQAEKVYKPITTIIELEPELAAHYRLKYNLSRVTKETDPSAEIRMVSSVGDREDGHDPHVTVMEELHAQAEDLFDVMKSSLGKRPNNLFLSISTAGRRASGIGWQTRQRLIAVLEGQIKQPQFFGAIYTVDAEDLKKETNLDKFETMMKSNPMYGITLDPSQIQEAMQEARGQPARWVEFKRTRFNIWQNSAGSLVTPEAWAACRKKMTLADFRGCRAWIGGDLASKRDIASIGIMFAEFGCVQIFNRYYVPTTSPKFGNVNLGAMYTAWAENGHLIRTPGGIIDYNSIEEDIRAWCTMFDVQAIGFDKYQSNQILASLFADGLPATEVGAGIQVISDPAKDFFAQIENGTLEHDGNPVTDWMAMNVVGYTDKRDNILPQKESPNSENKIDGIAAQIIANVLRLDAELDIKVNKPHPWAVRGNILGYGEDG